MRPIGRAIGLKLTAMTAAVIVVTVGSHSPTAAQQKIMIDGSTGTAPLISAVGKAFTAKHKTEVEIGKGLGTKARFDALKAGQIDIAMASHGLNVSEVTGMGMKVHRVAMTPVVFGVHQSVKVAALSDAQICALYEKPGRNWKEFGGPDLAIAPHTRPDSEVDTEVVRDGVACLKSLKFPDGVKSVARAGDMAKALAETPGAIGMTSATVVEQSRGTITAIALNGVAPSESNVTSGRYRLTRDAFLVTSTAPSEHIKAFIDFVKSAESAAVIKTNGAFPAKD